MKAVSIQTGAGHRSRRWFLKALALSLGARYSAVGQSTGSLPLGPLSDASGRIVSLDPSFDRLISKSAVIERLQTGGRWSEGPNWDEAHERLIWSDIPNNRQWSWNEADRSVSIYREPSRQTNGSCFDAQRRIICCEQVGRRVARYESEGSETVLADSWNGKPLNSPNDVVTHPDGGVWFTDPGYGNKGKLELKEAVYRIDPSSGSVDRVESSMGKPNGICFSEDFKRMYIADTGPDRPRPLYVFDVEDGRRLTNRRKFADVTLNGVDAGPDGQQVDQYGNLWASAGHSVEGVNGVHVFSPSGQRIGLVLLPEGCANVCFGGSDGHTLFMTATTSLYSVETRTRAAHGS